MPGHSRSTGSKSKTLARRNQEPHAKRGYRTSSIKLQRARKVGGARDKVRY